ncbi:hypothetical protein [Microbispora sp. GKU 823]|uniref:hypothetical protein n=1 Tax=Microbispora sp. GKU 823 TaxID=1652100 RepID=UPI00117EAC37|nr:hypothetical protein [Microbispora sp. GKU 823]
MSGLARKFSETAGFAAGFRKKLEDATKRIPKIELDANSTPAEVKIAELRKRLETLRDKKVGVDIDAGAALAEMHVIQRELASIDDREVSFDVRAGISGAMAELAAVDAEIARLDGQDAQVRVNADISGAMRGIATVSSALAALAAGPALVSIGAVGAGLGAAFGAAGAGAAGFAAVAIPALGRVNKALQQQQSAAGGAGGAVQSLAQQQAQAAQQALSLAQAQERVRRANEGVRDAARGVVQAQDDVKRAQQAVAQASADGAARVADAVRRVSDAERQHTDAVRAARDAQEALNDARKQATRDLEDLADRLTDTKLDQRQAALDLADAQKQLEATKANPKSTAADIERATIAYERSQQRVKELATAVERLTADKAEADRKGVEGSDVVKSAQERLADANQRVADSQQAIADAQRGVAEAQTQAARDVAAAQDRVAAAQERLLDAQRRYSDAQRDAITAEKQLRLERLQQKAALEKVGGAAGGAASKMSDLNQREKDLAKDVQGFKDAYVDWQRTLESDVFPAITGGMDLIESQLPRISPLVRTAGQSFQILEADAAKALKAPFWSKFLFDLDTAMPTAIVGLGHTAGNVFTGMAGILDAFLPHAGDVVTALEKGSQRFADWGMKLKDSPEWAEFVAFVKREAPIVAQLIEDIATSGGHIVSGLAPLGVSALDGLALIAKLTKNMDPDTLQLVAVGIGAIYSAIKVGGAVNKGVELISGLRTKIDDTGKAAAGARGKLAGFTSSVSGIGVKAGIASAGLLILGEKFASIEQSADRYAEKTAALGGDDLAKEIAAVNAELEKQKDKIGWAIFGKLHFSQASADAANRAESLEKKLADLKHQQELEAIKAKAAGDATGTMGDQIANARKAVDDMNKSFDTFSARTDAAQALQGLKKDYDDVKKAISDANGQLDVSKAKTDAQRDAIILAREKFVGYIQNVRDTADAQAKASGKTFDATKTILEQLPHMVSLAGKNREAREQVLLLAQAYGISRDDAIKAAKGGKDLQDVLAKLKSKSIRVEANTQPALDTINQLIRTVDGKTIRIGVDVRSEQQEFGAQKSKANEAGAIERYASGGLRSTPPNVAARPTILYGEGRAPEAFIPYEMQYRQRATELLSQVAADFGMQLVPARGVLESVGAASSLISSQMGQATATLSDTLGESGSVTSRIAALSDATTGVSTTVGESLTNMTVVVKDSAGKLDKTVSTTATAMSKSIALLKQQIASLEAALAKAQSASKTTSGSGSGSTKSASTSKSKTTGTASGDLKQAKKSTPKAGYIEPAGPTKSSSGGLIEGSAGGSMVSAHSGGVTVNFNDTVIRETADVDVMTERMTMRLNAYG